MIARPKAYGFDTDALKYICSYLKRRKQRTKVNYSHSSFAEILLGITRGSILGSLLFTTYICGFFGKVDDLDFASFADANTPYSCFLGQLRGIDKIFHCFAKHFLRGNAGKCHLPVQKLLWKTRYQTSQ